ncbi:MAG: ATP synthase F1 subunit gamma [Clostridiales bacterium]|jgi:F-type H+-transporting ATPase subunit gamma|nr:ATP synthase F1 subunit gamma [Clostridiales bacterium]
MASMRAIKRRIRSVAGTQQITKAMNLVAASKLQRAAAKLESARPFFRDFKILAENAISGTQSTSPYLKQRSGERLCVIVITGDRGLAGGYNVNVCKAAMALLDGKEGENVITVGVKGRDYFRRRRKRITRAYSGFSELPFYQDAQEIAMVALDLFDAGEVDEVHVAYTQFASTLSHIPTTQLLLPLKASTGSGLMEFEPGEEAFIEQLIPKHISTQVYGAMLESSACEQSARMAGMDSATKNSSDLISKLTLSYNRARQDAITQELTEIVSGANALD